MAIKTDNDRGPAVSIYDPRSPHYIAPWKRTSEQIAAAPDLGPVVLQMARREQQQRPRRGDVVRVTQERVWRALTTASAEPQQQAVEALIRFCAMTKGDVQAACRKRGAPAGAINKLLQEGVAKHGLCKPLQGLLRLEADKLRTSAGRPSLTQANHAVADHLEDLAQDLQKEGRL